MSAKDSKSTKAFLDIDLNGNREAYARACAFVEATDMRHGWTSKELEKLGGSEKKRIQEAYESDWQWKDKGRIMIQLPKERIVIELYEKECPTTVNNFKLLCTGKKGKGKAGKALHFKGCRFHRIIKGSVCQGGDITMGNGSGGESVYGKKFKDERNGLKMKFDARGIVGMSNSGKNSNSSQFFFAFSPRPTLNGKHVVFGKIVEGFEVLDMIEKEASAEDGKPKIEVTIADCGIL
eukprot:CAMPEP_0114514036 /NCGR_PEP_ID=MMETSP0109-20121206/15923_1 /TAXON_ID=29199 /ORGANISM="Chlorarachnion reptans, Strain CCCM449" /LENGTH=235 /DNA_ID=CAMNT_0001694017 /DNA_START=239 /DNA_END=946 /DNA_ORIENTATION=-